MDYELLTAQLAGFAEADGWYVPLMANAAALLYDAMTEVNWVGFYLLRGGKLVVALWGVCRILTWRCFLTAFRPAPTTRSSFLRDAMRLCSVCGSPRSPAM